MRRRSVKTIFLATVFAVCTELTPAACSLGQVQRQIFPSPALRQPEEEFVRLTMFRYILKEARQWDVSAIFLRDEHSDPSPWLIAKLKPLNLPLRKVSSADRMRGGNAAVLDPKTGRRGIIVRVISIRWLNSASAVLRAGTYASLMDSMEREYYLKKVAGRWKVTGKSSWVLVS